MKITNKHPQKKSYKNKTSEKATGKGREGGREDDLREGRYREARRKKQDRLVECGEESGGWVDGRVRMMEPTGGVWRCDKCDGETDSCVGEREKRVEEESEGGERREVGWCVWRGIKSERSDGRRKK